MQIVIDIPQEMYQRVKDGMWCGNHTIGHALADGVVLPEHGRLIDADALMGYCLNQKDKTIDCNDIARYPCVIGRSTNEE